MNQRKSKKQTKLLEIRSLTKQPDKKAIISLPTYGYVNIGKKKFNVRYADQIKDIVSSETYKQPAKPMKKSIGGVRMLSRILRNTGIDSLIDIGDAIINKY